jgi:hypothetical protein
LYELKRPTLAHIGRKFISLERLQASHLRYFLSRKTGISSTLWLV